MIINSSPYYGDSSASKRGGSNVIVNVLIFMQWHKQQVCHNLITIKISCTPSACMEQFSDVCVHACALMGFSTPQTMHACTQFYIIIVEIWPSAHYSSYKLWHVTIVFIAIKLLQCKSWVHGWHADKYITMHACHQEYMKGSKATTIILYSPYKCVVTVECF